MNLTLLVITDGRRSCLEPTLASFAAATHADDINETVIVNDCPHPDYARWVDTLGFDHHIRLGPTKRGFAAAIQAGWDATRRADHLFHLEDDFEFVRPIDLPAMRTVVDTYGLAQMALRRQPWNELEVEAGGFIEMHPDAYAEQTDGTHHWLTHRLFFTTNPSLYPRRITDQGWPLTRYSEGMFSQRLFSDPNIDCAFWGRLTDPPWVTHIGYQRAGEGY